jgi:hypothetical protein
MMPLQPPVAPFVAGSMIAGKYRLLREIGAGAMGRVWAALNETTSREVALKLIVGRDEELRLRLQREARACGALQHRNIIDVYDVAQTDEGGAGGSPARQPPAPEVRGSHSPGTSPAGAPALQRGGRSALLMLAALLAVICVGGGALLVMLAVDPGRALPARALPVRLEMAPLPIRSSSAHSPSGQGERARPIESAAPAGAPPVASRTEVPTRREAARSAAPRPECVNPKLLMKRLCPSKDSSWP